MGLGMFLLNFSDPLNFEPFILISVITSAALIPILLTKRKAPTFKKISTMSLQEAFISSPFGMVSSFFYGTIQSALFTLLAVYAATMNFSIFQISLVHSCLLSQEQSHSGQLENCQTYMTEEK